MRFSTRIAKIIFIITAVLLLVISTILFGQVNDLVNTNNRLNHTSEVKLGLEQVLSFSKDAETAQRGFLLTRDSLFLQPYATAFNGTRTSIEGLQKVILKNEQQKENLKKLDTLVQERFNSFYATIDSFFAINNDGAKRQILLKDKSLMDSIRRQVNKMEIIEIREMGKQLVEKNKHALLAPVATVLLIFFSLAVLIAAYYRITIDLKKSETYINQMKNLNKQLLEKNRQLKMSNDELDSFNYISSHDLQEPVRKIRTFISIIEEQDFGKISDKSKYMFERMKHSSIRIQELLNDLLNYSQINKATQNFSPVDLNEVLEKVKLQLNDLIEQTNAGITHCSLPVVNGDRFQLEQLFFQLISNGLKYKKENVSPQITIESVFYNREHSNKPEPILENYCQIVISDNGIGFDQMYEEKVFELFAQLHPTDDRPGTGIGLTICKKVVQNHGGFIKVTSQPDAGTRFYVYLPA